LLAAAVTSVAAIGTGCSSSPPPENSAPPPRAGGVPAPEGSGPAPIVNGAADSVSALPGSPGALYRYRFRQVEPGSDRFTFQDRELSFYFRPTPAALFFQVENRQDRPAWIDWDRCAFTDPLGSSGKIAHAPTRWQDRYRTLAQTQIPGLQRYSDYMFPISYLVDDSDVDLGEQPHRPLLPEDASALQYSDREFAVSLVFLIENQPRTYTFRFRVASVLRR
jgi:hypothetical protein